MPKNAMTNTTVYYACHKYKQMEEPVTDGDDYATHRQLVPVEDVTPISHSMSSSSSIAPLSPNDGSPGQKVSGSDGDNTVSPTKFTLPENWSVKKVPRRFGGPADKYYRDPESGRHFRSLKEVERYINGGILPTHSKVKKLNDEGVIESRVKKLNYLYDEKEKVENKITEIITYKKSRVRKLKYHHDDKNSEMIVASDKILKVEENKDQLAIVVSPTNVSTSSFNLPDGWVVEEVPRVSGTYTDKYYYEPGTGVKFRSLLAVQKHLTQVEEDNSPLSVVLEEIKENHLPISKAFKLKTCIKNCGSYSSWKKSLLLEKEKRSHSNSVTCPPSKINWVIGGNGGENWNAFEDEKLVPDSVKQQWGNTFMMAINNTKNTSG